MTEWKALVEKVTSLSKKTKIALVGKYVELTRCLYFSCRSIETCWICI